MEILIIDLDLFRTFRNINQLEIKEISTIIQFSTSITYQILRLKHHHIQGGHFGM